MFGSLLGRDPSAGPAAEDEGRGGRGQRSAVSESLHAGGRRLLFTGTDGHHQGDAGVGEGRQEKRRAAELRHPPRQTGPGRPKVSGLGVGPMGGMGWWPKMGIVAPQVIQRWLQ